MAQNGRPAAPPYVSFKTFLGFLDWLNEDGVVLPSRLDRSFWGERLSGANGTQLMSALRFLRLIDESNRPLSGLEEIGQDRTPERDKRKSIVRDRLSKCYGDAVRGLDLERASAGELLERFRSYHVEGETLRKALAFYVHAADYCGLRLSPHITKKTRSIRRANGARKRTRTAKKSVVDQESPADKQTLGPTPESELHPSLRALLADLMQSGHNWTRAKRNLWVTTFISNVDYVYPVEDI